MRMEISSFENSLLYTEISFWMVVGPALSMGSIKAMQWDDKWTTVTADGSLTAQFKHTVIITEFGAEVLTPSRNVWLHGLERIRTFAPIFLDGLQCPQETSQYDVFVYTTFVMLLSQS